MSTLFFIVWTQVILIPILGLILMGMNIRHKAICAERRRAMELLNRIRFNARDRGA